MALRLDDYLPALDDAPAGLGRPLLLAIALIDEDPAQPRLDFDDDALAELARTIAERGVRQPISVRPHPTQSDRWLLNFGARRLRAAKLAGRTEIPAFVDETADSYDQVIENEHRQALKPLELALFVERQLKAGQSKAEVARRLGKSGAYLTYVCALIDAPDWLLELYRSGRCRGPLELYEARLLGETDPNAVCEMLETPKPMTRAEIVARRRAQEASHRSGTAAVQRTPRTSSAQPRAADQGTAVGQASAIAREPAGNATGGVRRENTSAADELRFTCVAHGRLAHVVLSHLPSDRANVFVRFDGDSVAHEVGLADVSALAVKRALGSALT